MSQSKKKQTDNKSIEKASSSITTDSAPKWSRTGFIIASVVIAIILIVVGVFYYQERVAPFHRTIITVDDTTINMDYFLKRTRLTGTDPMSMIDVLTREQVIMVEAPRYGIEVSREDIDQELRRIALGDSETISESEFKAWYRQMLNESELSDSEYREYVAIRLTAARLHANLAERVPPVAEQIHFHAIQLATYEEAEEARARLEAGEDFADLARELSLDEASRETGGDIGWLPRGIMEAEFDYIAFNLSIGEVSEPMPVGGPIPIGELSATTEFNFIIIMVSEKAAARELDEQSLQALRNLALADWLSVEIALHDISYNFNSEIYAWINWQLAKQ